MADSFKISEQATLYLSVGDITKWEGDAIVNAANERMLGGGGVDGAIHRAAGDELYNECFRVPEVKRGVRCPTGSARITKGYRLKVKHIIHTVGPIYEDDEESEPLLRGAYASSLALANEHGLKSLAFPAISCGVFGYPAGKAAQVAFKAILSSVGGLEKVEFVLFDQKMHSTFKKVALEVFAPPTLTPNPTPTLTPTPAPAPTPTPAPAPEAEAPPKEEV